MKKHFPALAGHSCNHNPSIIATFSLGAFLIGIILGGLFSSWGFDATGDAVSFSTKAAQAAQTASLSSVTLQPSCSDKKDNDGRGGCDAVAGACGRKSSADSKCLQFGVEPKCGDGIVENPLVECDKPGQKVLCPDGSSRVCKSECLLDSACPAVTTRAKVSCSAGQIIGDVDGDKKVTTTDVNLATDVVIGKIPQPANLCCIDMDQNKLVNAIDVQRITNIFLGKAKSPGVCPAQPSCGNGVVEAGEQCDPPAANACAAGFTGSQGCDAKCQNFNACVAAPPAAQCGDGADNDGDALVDFPADPGCTDALDNDEFNTICGNNIIEASEQCDGTQLGGATCPVGTMGMPACTPQCTSSTAGCTSNPFSVSYWTGHSNSVYPVAITFFKYIDLETKTVLAVQETKNGQTTVRTPLTSYSGTYSEFDIKITSQTNGAIAVMPLGSTVVRRKSGDDLNQLTPSSCATGATTSVAAVANSITSACVITSTQTYKMKQESNPLENLYIALASYVSCGNGVVDGGEQCDGAAFDTAGGFSATCPAGFTGQNTCSANCVVQNGCVSQCGNGQIDQGEECDGNLLAPGQTNQCPAGTSGQKTCSACRLTGQCTQASCDDTDSGQVFGIQGTVTEIFGASTFQATDACLSSNVLEEWYCDGLDAKSLNFSCTGTGGCANGACQ